MASPTISETGKWRWQRAFDIPVRGHVVTAETIRVTISSTNVKQHLSPQMLAAVVGFARKPLEQILGACSRINLDTRVNHTLLWWAFHDQDGFRNVIKNLKNFGVLPTHKDNEYTKGTHTGWTAFLHSHDTEERKATWCLSRSDVTTEIAAAMNTKDRKKKRQGTRNAERTAVREHVRSAKQMMLTAGVAMMEELSGLAYDRIHDNMLVLLDKNTRKTAPWAKYGRHTIIPPRVRTTAQIVRTLEELGYDARTMNTRVVVPFLDNAGKARQVDVLEHGTEDDAFEEPIGILHDRKHIIGAMLQVMYVEGNLAVSLNRPDDAPEPDDELHCVGEFEVSRTIWGDGFPAASRDAGNIGFWLNDPSKRLLKKGISLACPAGLYKGNETLAIRLMEREGEDLASDAPHRIEFPNLGTYMLLKMPLRMLSADNKMYCGVLCCHNQPFAL